MGIGRIIYKFFGLIFPILYLLSDKNLVLAVLGIIIGIYVLLDVIRFLIYPKFNKFLIKKMRFMKEYEYTHIFTAHYLFWGFFITTFLFSKEIAVLCMAYLILGDGFASQIGKRYGKHKIFRGRSLEGSIAGFTAALISGLILINFLNISLVLAVIGALIATLVEMFTFWADDNLTVPIITGALLTLISLI